MNIIRYFSPRKAWIRFFLLFFGFSILFYSWIDSLGNNQKSKIFFLFDNSLSMTVQDIINPDTQILFSRFFIAQDFAKNFIKNFDFDSSFAIGSFSSNIVLESPFSDDKILNQNVISGISPIIYGGGSDIFASLEAFSQIYSNYQNIDLIIFSDGEFFEEIHNIPKMPYGTRIFLVAIGTTSGGNMILEYDNFGKPIYKEFKNNIAISKLSLDSVKNFSKAINSDYFVVSSYEDIQNLDKILIDFLVGKDDKKNFFLNILAYFSLFIAIFINIYPYDKVKN